MNIDKNAEENVEREIPWEARNYKGENSACSVNRYFYIYARNFSLSLEFTWKMYAVPYAA